MTNTKNGKKLGKKIAGGFVKFGEGLKEGYAEEKEKTKKEKAKMKLVVEKKVVAKPKKRKTTKITTKKAVAKKKPTTKTKNGKKLGKAVMGGIIEFGEGAREAYTKECKVAKRKTTKKPTSKRKKRSTEMDYFF